MQRSINGELIPIDPKIERTFHLRLVKQEQHRKRPKKEVQLANEQNNAVVYVNEEEIRHACWGFNDPIEHSESI